MVRQLTLILLISASTALALTPIIGPSSCHTAAGVLCCQAIFSPDAAVNDPALGAIVPIFPGPPIQGLVGVDCAAFGAITQASAALCTGIAACCSPILTAEPGAMSPIGGEAISTTQNCEIVDITKA